MSSCWGGCWGREESEEKKRERVEGGKDGERAKEKHETGPRRRNWKQMAHELNHDVEA